jgi:hypothetical protein
MAAAHHVTRARQGVANGERLRVALHVQTFFIGISISIANHKIRKWHECAATGGL